MVKIKVGVLCKSAGWELLLRQEGVPFEFIHSDIATDRYSIVVIGSDIEKKEVDNVKKYLSSGGSVLISATAFATLSGTQAKSRPLQSLLPYKNEMFDDVSLIDVFKVGHIPKNANMLPSSDGRNTGYIGEFAGGNVIVLPFDAGELILDSRTADKSFYSSHHRLPFETVSLVSKGSVRRLVSRSLEYLHHRRGLPYIHTWYFPHAERSLFAFRIDTDYSSQEEIERLYRLSQDNHFPFTWFVDTKSQQSFIEIFGKMKDQEIGVHCYEHSTYSDYKQNLENINKAKAILNKVNLSPKGFAAPFGKWNPQLAKAISEAGFEYSSEFSFDYDNEPSYPVVEGTSSNVLQIPIHPISIGNLKRLGYSETMMNEYFSAVIEQKIALREPVFLYHHPKNGHEEILQEYFRSIQQKKLSATTFSEYASWWKQRNDMNLEIELENDLLSTKSKNEDQSVFLHIIKENKAETFSQIKEKLPFAELHWEPKAAAYSFPDHLPRIRKFNPWISIIRLQDATVGKIKKGEK